MDEVKSFMRFIIPGLTVLIVSLLLFVLSGDLNFNEIDLTSFEKIIVLFVSSGALGYLISNIYFPLIWLKPFSKMLCDSQVQICV